MGATSAYGITYFEEDAASAATTDSYVTKMDPKIAGFGRITVWVKNTHGSNGVHYKVDGSLDGSNWGAIKAETALAAGISAFETSTTPYQYIRLQVKNQTGGQAASAQSSILGLA